MIEISTTVLLVGVLVLAVLVLPEGRFFIKRLFETGFFSVKFALGFLLRLLILGVIGSAIVYGGWWLYVTFWKR